MQGEDPIPPYRESARHAAVLAAQRRTREQMHATIHDADWQQHMGMRAKARSRRDMTLATGLVTAFSIVAALCMYFASRQRGNAEDAFMWSGWWVLGSTLAIGGVYLALGGIERAIRRRNAGERLLLRAKIQRRRALEGEA